jgi:uncharacterized protein YcbX
MSQTNSELGTVLSLWRYPVKSMMGEELTMAEVGARGVTGDRAYGLVAVEDAKVASAKNPGKWPKLFAFRAAFVESPGQEVRPLSVRITLPDGRTVTSEQSDINEVLSKALGRNVILAVTKDGTIAGVRSAMPSGWAAQAEEYWPDIDGRKHRDTTTDFTLPAGTFFDGAIVHLVTTATFDRLRGLYPQGRFEAPRFRPNIIVRPSDGEQGFVEQAWIDHDIAIGEHVRLRITGPCARCVMTTLAQGDLPKDPGILRTAVQHNQGHVGVYAAVVQGGAIRRGDRVRLCE